MNIPPAVRDFWSAFAAQSDGDVTARFYEAFHFSDREKSADELGQLVLAGIKRATASTLWTYESEGKPVPKPGDLSIVTNWNGEPLCVIETVCIDIVPFDEVDAGFAATEGEGDGSLEYWHRGHIACFGRECDRLEKKFVHSMPVVCERFEVIYPPEAKARWNSRRPRSGHAVPAHAGTGCNPPVVPAHAETGCNPPVVPADAGTHDNPTLPSLTALLLAFLISHSTPTDAQDYAREKRWADEIVPAVVVGDPVYLQQSRGKDPAHKFLGLYAEAPNAKTAIVLVHGVGVHPDHGIIGALRVKLNDAGYTTLAIQMPVAGSEAKVEDYYPTVFGEAAERIAVAGRWLQDKGYRQVVLLSHSMGAWMANEYLLNSEPIPYAAWVCMGITGRITSPASIKLPTLDIYGENDLDNTRRAAPWRRLMKMFMASGSVQVEVPGADHYYAGRENQAAAEVVIFLKARGL